MDSIRKGSKGYCTKVGGVFWPPYFLAGSVESKCAQSPYFLPPCCCTWPVIHSISSADSGWTLHARWFLYSTLNINVDFIRLLDCINCIKMFGSGWAGSAQTPWGVHEREGKKGGLTEGEVAWTSQDLWQIAATAQTDRQTDRCLSQVL